MAYIGYLDWKNRCVQEEELYCYKIWTVEFAGRDRGPGDQGCWHRVHRTCWLNHHRKANKSSEKSPSKRMIYFLIIYICVLKKKRRCILTPMILTMDCISHWENQWPCETCHFFWYWAVQFHRTPPSRSLKMPYAMIGLGYWRVVAAWTLRTWEPKRSVGISLHQIKSSWIFPFAGSSFS